MADPNAGYVPPPYPPQQQAAYPPPQPQPGYPPQGYGQKPGPPPYQPQPGYPAQQSSTNVVVVQQQPRVVTTTVYTRRYGTGDHGLAYAIIASCIVFWCAGWVGLVCTIPAIFFSLNAQQEEHAGNLETMKQHHNWSLILSTVGLVAGFGCFFLWIILSATAR